MAEELEIQKSIVEDTSPTAEELMVALQTDGKLVHLIDENHLGEIANVPFKGFPRLFESSDFADVSLLVGPKQTVIRAHRAILCERSGYFEALFRSNLEETKTKEVHLVECHEASVKSILRYLYTGRIIHSEHPGYVARLYKEADYLQVPELKKYVISYFEMKMKNFTWPLDDGNLPASYIVGMISGMEECTISQRDWEELEGLFERIVNRSEYRTWLTKHDFVEMLDTKPTVARMLLQRRK